LCLTNAVTGHIRLGDITGPIRARTFDILIRKDLTLMRASPLASNADHSPESRVRYAMMKGENLVCHVRIDSKARAAGFDCRG
jgi:hypothetical protein